MRQRLHGVLAATALLGAWACFRDKTPVASPRAAQLNDLVDVVVLPTYADAEVRSRELIAAVEAHCSAPDDARLDAARAAWRQTHAAWKRTEAFRFGPVDDRRLGAAIDFWPVRRADVDAVLRGEAPITDASVARLGSSATGLPVLELLLFEAGADPAEPRRCAYAAALARRLATQTAELVAAWDVDSGYGKELKTAGRGSATFMREQRAFDVVVNRLLATVLAVEDAGLARPLGRRDGGVAQPGAVEAPYADHSIEALTATLAGVRSVYACAYGGRKGKSLAAIVHAHDPELNADVDLQLDRVEAAAAAVPAPLSQAVLAAPETVEELHRQVKELHRLLAVDVAGALSVTATFSDNDGD